jgi:hypothetical protein
MGTLPRLLALALSAAAAGCGVLMVDNPSRSGLDCNQTRFYPVVDVVLAGAGTAFLIQQGTAADEPVTLAAPAVLLGSALWGNVKVSRCQRAWAEATPEQIAAFHRAEAEAAERRRQEDALAAQRAHELALANAQAQAAAQAAAQADAQARADAQAPEDAAWDADHRARADDPGPPPAPSDPGPPPASTVTVTATRFQPYGEACAPVSPTNTCGFGTCESVDDEDPSHVGFCMQGCSSDRDCSNAHGVALRCRETEVTNRQGRTFPRMICR